MTIDEEREVAVVDVEDSPGGAGALLQRLADARINVQFLYLATRTRVVVGAESADAVRRALSQAMGPLGLDPPFPLPRSRGKLDMRRAEPDRLDGTSWRP